MRKLLALVAMVFVAACGSPPGIESRRPSTPRLNLLLVTLDTTRADALGIYGGHAVTPSLDQIGAEGVVFEQASTVAPLTLPAHASLLTALFPPRHGIHGNGQNALGPEPITLAEQLRAGGLRTGAFVSSFVLDRRWGLDRGFEMYHDVAASSSAPRDRDSIRRPAERVVDDALEWMNQVRDGPFFAWLHFYDAHAPVRPPAEFAPVGSSGDYLAAIGFVDFQLARVMTFLAERGLTERTMVVVVGDHGESLGEHGEPTHGLFVYQAVMHVPLIVYVPVEGMQRRRISEPVRIVDVMPTILDILGERAPADLDGETLVPLMAGLTPPSKLEAYSESQYGFDRFGWSPLSALREGRFKLILAPRPELYDLETDPAESVNLYHARADLAASMTRRLRSLTRSGETHSPANPIDALTRARLAALGYVAGSRPSPGEPSPTLADPKDQIDLYNQFTREPRSQGELP